MKRIRSLWPVTWRPCYSCGHRAELYINGRALTVPLRRRLPACYTCAAYALPHLRRVEL